MLSRITRYPFLAALTAFFISFFIPSPVFPQRYFSHIYTEADGLPSSVVYDLAQDKYGQIWFLTGLGVAKFDGQEWKNYKFPLDLPHINYQQLAADEDKNIWAITAYFDLARFVNGKWVDYYSAGKDSLISRGIINFEVLKWDNKVVFAAYSSNTGLMLFKDGGWQKASDYSGLKDVYLGCFDVHRNIITACGDFSLVSINENNTYSLSYEELGLPTSTILGIKADYPDNSSEPVIWLSGDTWLGRIKTDRFELLHTYDEKITRETILCPDSTGGIFVANPLGTYHYYADGRFKPFGVESGLAADGTWSMLRDREQNYWFAGERGVTKIPSFRFTNYYKENGLLEDEVSSILQDKSGNYIFGHNLGITIFSGNDFKRIDFSGKSPWQRFSTRVMDLKRDFQGNIWIGAGEYGLGKMGLNQSIEWYRFAEEDFYNIYCLEIDPNGAVLIGTNNGLFRLHQGRFERDKAFPVEFIRKLLIAKDGALYICLNREGIARIKNDIVARYRSREQLAEDAYALYEGDDGTIFVGTRGGLMKIEGDSLKKFAVNGFKIERPVYFILEDEVGNYWFGTDNGVIRWDGQCGRLYDRKSGLAGLETNRASGYLDRQGDLWIGTNTGLSKYNREFDAKEREAALPEVELISLEVKGNKFKPTANLKLKLNSSMVLHYRCVSFLEEGKVRYKIELKDINGKVLDEFITDSRDTYYPGIKPGKCRFLVSAQDGLGRWSEAAATGIITVIPPLYLQTWFILLGFVIFIVMVALMFNNIATRRYSERLKQQVSIRTAELEESNIRLKGSITELERAGNALVESEAGYRAVMEQSADGIYLADYESKRIIEVNTALERLLGYSADEMQKMAIYDFVLHTRGDIDDKIDQLRQKGPKLFGERSYKKSDSSIINVEVSGTIIPYGGTEVVCVVIRDLTERKRIEEEKRRLEDRIRQAQKIESLSILAGGVAHDYNNMLQSILGNASLALMEMKKDDPSRELIETVEKTSHRAANLTRQMLAYSGRGSFMLEFLNLFKLVENSKEIIQTFLPKQVSLDLNLEKNLPLIEADEAQIMQALSNVVINGVEAIGDSEGQITISAGLAVCDAEYLSGTFGEEDLPSGSYVFLEIADNGIGMDETTIEKIFDPFFSTKFTGRGLGLAAVLGIMRGHKGAIKVESTAGAGSRFRLLFPTVEKIIESPAEALQKAGEVKSKGTILVADDETSVRRISERMLNKLGYDVITAEDGKEAIDIFREKFDSIDLTLMDVSMPRIDGREAIKAIRKIHKNALIVISSGSSEDELRSNYDEVAPDGFIQKPYKLSALQDKIESILKK